MYIKKNAKLKEKLKIKTRNSRKKLKTQEKNSIFRHIHMLAMWKMWPICKPALNIP